jgi:hypothetical protein
MYTRAQLKVTSALPVGELMEFQLEQRENEHAHAFFSFILPQKAATYASNEPITLEIEGSSEPVFSGLILSTELSSVNGLTMLDIEAVSGTWLLDREPHTRTFQNARNYASVIELVLSAYPQAVFRLGAWDTTCIPLLVQYQETDWEFLKRLASHLGTTLTPAALAVPCFCLGAYPEVEYNIPNQNSRVLISRKFYEEGGASMSLQRGMFHSYEVASDENYRLGNYAHHRDNSLLICRKSAVLQNDILRFTFTLAAPVYLHKTMFFNEKLSGVSLIGTVLEATGTEVKIHFDADLEQDEIGRAHV